MMCGFGYLPYAAARDGHFFSVFAHRSEKYEGLADYSLLAIGALSAFWCLFSLDIVIEIMAAMIVLLQFFAQSVGLMWYRYNTPKEHQARGWRMPLYPLPCVIQAILFFFIFITSDSVILWGSSQPILELSVSFLIVGCVCFYVRAYKHKTWPYCDPNAKFMQSGRYRDLIMMKLDDIVIV